jgi:hypothetical protein
MNQLINLLSPAPALAQGKAWTSVCVTDGVATIKGFECLFQNILQIIVGAAGLVFFAMFISGGFKYLTSGGDPKKAAAATSTLTMSLIGIIGVIASWLILLFIRNFTGIDPTIFKVGK